MHLHYFATELLKTGIFISVGKHFLNIQNRRVLLTDKSFKKISNQFWIYVLCFLTFFERRKFKLVLYCPFFTMTFTMSSAYFDFTKCIIYCTKQNQTHFELVFGKTNIYISVPSDQKISNGLILVLILILIIT